MEHDDPQVKQAFEALRREAAAGTPPFRATVAAARTRCAAAPGRRALGLAAAVMLVVVGVVGASVVVCSTVVATVVAGAVVVSSTVVVTGSVSVVVTSATPVAASPPASSRPAANSATRPTSFAITATQPADWRSVVIQPG